MPNSQPPMLFVPGAMLGGWVWEDNFRRFFDEQGYETHTIDFSGTGQPFGKRIAIRFSDYVQECVERIRCFQTAPIVVSHSMGGLLCLHAACRVDVEKLVLLSPAPIQGMVPSLVSLFKRSPSSLIKFLLTLLDTRVASLGMPPLGVFSSTCCPRQMANIIGKLGSEPIAVLLALLRPPTLDKHLIKTNQHLFIGATGDYIIPPREVLRSARLLESEYKEYSDMCHTYQAEREWRRVAEDILSWIQKGHKP